MDIKYCKDCDHTIDKEYENGMIFCKRFWCLVYGLSVGCPGWEEKIEVW